MKYRVGTRGSKLALVQTQGVIDQLKNLYSEDDFEMVVIKTTGDRQQEKPLDSIGSKGLFVDEIEKALIEDRIQLAVHSMKDMPEEPLEGLTFSKAWKREDPRDVLIFREVSSLSELKPNGVIGTGSKRRAVQLKKLRPDIEIVDIRGNVDTRIRKLMEPDGKGPVYDGIVLAAAGLKRLGRDDEISQYLSYDEMIPAPTQGILAIELRADNSKLMKKINALSDEASQKAAVAEREFLRSVGGDCHMPIGAFLDTETNYFYTLIGDADGCNPVVKKEKYEQ